MNRMRDPRDDFLGLRFTAVLGVVRYLMYVQEHGYYWVVGLCTSASTIVLGDQTS